MRKLIASFMIGLLSSPQAVAMEALGAVTLSSPIGSEDILTVSIVFGPKQFEERAFSSVIMSSRIQEPKPMTVLFSPDLAIGLDNEVLVGRGSILGRVKSTRLHPDEQGALDVRHWEISPLKTETGPYYAMSVDDPNPLIVYGIALLSLCAVTWLYNAYKECPGINIDAGIPCRVQCVGR
jgi:hypothetical protein